MRLKGIWILCALVLGIVGFAAAGCGGGGESTTTVTVTEAADTTESEDMTATDETDTDMTLTDDTMTDESMSTTETESMGEETTATGGDTPDLSFLDSDSCREYVQLMSSYSDALSGGGDTDVEEAASAMHELADKAPDEIKDDFAVFADYFDKIADALDGVDLNSGDTPNPEALAKLMTLSQDLDMTAIGTASTNISTWLSTNCSGS